MLGYMHGLNQALDNEYAISILKYPFFTECVDGLRPMLENLFAEQQLQLLVTKFHNVLPKLDTSRILCSHACLPNHAAGCVSTLVLVVGIFLGIRPTAMIELTIDQFVHVSTNVKGI